MSVNFELPELGEGIEEADVLKVLVAPGDAINEEDPIIEIETEKATVEVPAPHAGSISAVLVAAGDTIKVGQTLCIIEAMKIFNEIESDFDGEVVEVLVDDQSPVEFNQEIFSIRPN